MTRRFAFLAAAVVLAVSACTPAPTEGIVVDHRYDHAFTTFIQVRPGVLVPVRHDEDWNLLIENGDDRAWVEVSEAEYERYEVGDPWTRTEG